MQISDEIILMNWLFLKLK